MPELPEVEIVRRGLEELIVGMTIKSIKHDNEKSFPNDPTIVSEFAQNAKIVGVRRRAKVLLIDLSTQYTFMTHLKMTGQLVFVGAKRWGAGHPNNSLVSTLPDKSTRVTIEFIEKTKLYFNDQRKFGWMKLIPTELIEQESFMQKVGPEPLEPEFTDSIFIKRVQKRPNTTIKAAILDQTVLAGVGNIYADESLWASKIHPATLVKKLSNKQLSKLRSEILNVLNSAIDRGGSTDRNYVNAEGEKGSYIDFAKVFRREGEACFRCRSIVTKTRVAGRGTHVCLGCQQN